MAFGINHGGLLGRVADRDERSVGGDGAVYRCLVSLYHGRHRFGRDLAVRGKPPLTMFRQPRWLLLLAIATAGLLGNFVFFSSSPQYLSPTASQVIGQLSPVGMMFASVLILKERMRITQSSAP